MNNFNLYYKIFELGIDDTMRQDTTAHGVKQQADKMLRQAKLTLERLYA
jgi:hypothetical protein